MINDDHRGYIMELTATKLLSLEQGVQIVGMSATLSVRNRPVNSVHLLIRAEYRGPSPVA